MFSFLGSLPVLLGNERKKHQDVGGGRDVMRKTRLKRTQKKKPSPKKMFHPQYFVHVRDPPPQKETA